MWLNFQGYISSSTLFILLFNSFKLFRPAIWIHWKLGNKF
uniref:Uncharacterized protein n=1 Tax=Rhizophora mucronata TaxID=61149 RepID=A0A2P2LGY6_RHIMU